MPAKSEPCVDVVFRVFPEGDVIALFPKLSEGRGMITSYQHIGQHGDARSSLVRELRAASPSEYAALLKELRDVGYCLRVKK